VFDINRDGVFDFREFKELMWNGGMELSDSALTILFIALDTDRSGTIDREEFRKLIEVVGLPEKELLTKVFEIFDSKKTGFIDALAMWKIVHKVKAVARIRCSLNRQRSVSKFMSDFDMDSKQKICLSEFLKMMEGIISN